MSRSNLSLGINIQNIIKVITIFALPHHVFIRYFIIMSLPCNFHHTTHCRFCYMFFAKHCAAHAYVFIPIVWYYVIFLRWKRLYASFFLSFVYICIAVKYLVIKRGGGITLTGQPRNLLVQKPSQGIDFQRHMSWSRMFVSVSWSERLLFMLLIIVECLTKIVLTFFS